jgi:N6-adenosine-specific RNA methylase IME4
MMSKQFQVIVADPPWSFKDSLKMSDVKRGAKANYSTMSICDIQQLPIKDLIDPKGSILALWVPSSLLQQGLDTMKSWGFAHKQTYVWVKTKKDPLKEVRGILFNFWKNGLKPLGKFSNKSFREAALNSAKVVDIIDLNKGKLFMQEMLAFGMGRLFRQSHEICLIGTSNNKIYKALANKSQRSVSFAPNLKHSAKPEHLQDSLEIMFPKGDKLELFARRLRPGWTCLGNEICNGEDIRVSLSKL